MSIVVTGSIATDHLMVFPGRFREQLIDGQLDHVSLSFLVDDLQMHRGGIGANIAFGLGQLGLRPILVGAVGADFAEYRHWLEQHNVNTDHIYVSPIRHTARFLCTTDSDHNQIASFYAGAMAEARSIDLGPIVAAIKDVQIVIVSPDDPAAMLRHTAACRAAELPFAADPSQQLARMEGPDIRQLVDGATYLFTNEYESDLLKDKTEWTDADILRRVGTWITTTGPSGATIRVAGEPSIRVGVPKENRKADPTGVGDAFRAGFLAGLSWGAGPERAAQIGCMLATLVIEHVGTQEYSLDQAAVADRFAEAYGSGAAAELRTWLSPTLASPVASIR
jgi:adenosine kinase